MISTKVLVHANGTEVTAQEAYDAFMNTRVLINAAGTGVGEAVSMVWYDNNSAQTAPLMWEAELCNQGWRHGGY